MELFVEKSPLAFLLVTVVLGGGVAFLAGRALARGWRPFWTAALYMAGLGLFVRFLHWGLFLDATFPSWREAKGDLFSLHYYLTDTAVLIAAAALGYRLERTRQMTTQYGWLFARATALTWRAKADGESR
ncbi:MAG: hypothetical protein NW215_15000 [Hyphomicrobiales bacterium]|nr:hypothetical protein [Hyphomicrobiales bacterium]